MLILGRVDTLTKDNSGYYLNVYVTYPHIDNEKLKSISVKKGITESQKLLWFNDTPYANFGIDLIGKTVLLSGWLYGRKRHQVKLLGVLDNGC